MKLGEIIAPAPLIRAGNKEYPLLSMTMKGGLVKPESKFKKRVASQDTSAYKVVSRNQLVIGFPIDEGVISFQNIYDKAIVSPAYNIWDLKIKDIEKKFIELYLKSPYAIAYYKSKLRGTTARRRYLSDDLFLDLELKIPPFPEQKRIVSILDKVDNLIRNRKQSIKLLDELVRAKFGEMFGDLETNDKGWEIHKFKDFATIDCKMTRDFYKYGSYPHIGIDNIEKDSGELVNYKKVSESELISGKYIFSREHILYSKIRPYLNKVALPDFSGLCSADAYPIMPNSAMCNRIFLALLMRSDIFLNYIIKLSGRTNIPKVNKSQIYGFNAPLPPKSLQDEFSVLFSKNEKVKQDIKFLLERIKALRTVFISTYFST